jgi:hypothetical protein
MKRLRHLTVLAFAVGIALAMTSSNVAVAAGDAFVGVFVMNAAKSKADPGPLPQSSKVSTEALESGKFKTSLDGVAADGTSEHWEATYARDGKDYPVTGNPNVDMIAVTLSDPNTIVVTQKKDGKVVSTITGKVSADGKTITSSVSGTNAEGQPVSSTIVSDRQ